MKTKTILIIALSLLLCSCGKTQSNTYTNTDKPLVQSNVAETKPTITEKPISTNTPIPTSTPVPVMEPLSESEIPYLYTNTSNYIGREVTLTGKIFNNVEYDTGSVAFQMWQDPNNSENNTIIIYYDNTIELKENDYVVISGTVYDVFEGENAFGGVVTAPRIIAEELSISSYAEIMNPTIKSIETGMTITQNGYEIILDKVEFAKSETRLYFTVNNNGKANFSVYDFNMKIVQGNKQYEYQDNWDADYPEIQSDLLPEVTTSGIVAFPSLDMESGFKVYVEGRSDDYREDFETYLFTIE